MGMSERDFGYMIRRVFFNKLKGFAKKKKEQHREEWERTRWAVWQLVSMSGKSLKGKVKLTDIIKFSWEKVVRTKVDYEENKERFDYLVKKFGKQWHSS